VDQNSIEINGGNTKTSNKDENTLGILNQNAPEFADLINWKSNQSTGADWQVGNSNGLEKQQCNRVNKPKILSRVVPPPIDWKWIQFDWKCVACYLLPVSPFCHSFIDRLVSATPSLLLQTKHHLHSSDRSIFIFDWKYFTPIQKVPWRRHWLERKIRHN